MNTILFEANIQLDLIKNKKALYILRAINHPLRLDILKLINERKLVNVTDIYMTLKLQQAVASQHLAILRRAGFLKTKKDGKFIYYTVSYSFIEHFSKTIDLMLDASK